MKRFQQGLSLIELMIAITLGLILLTGVMQVFISSKGVYSSQQALSRVQETGRLAMEFLARDIRMAGYMGCADPATMTVTNTLNNSATFPYNFGEGIRGYSQATQPGFNPAPLPNTDSIILRNASNSGVEIVANNDAAQLFVSDLGTEASACADGSNRISGLCQGDILVASDCAKAVVFQATNITVAAGGGKVNVVHSNAVATPGNAISSWGGGGKSEENLAAGAEILTATSTAYFIATGANEQGRPSLYQQLNAGPSVELLEGVENISLTYSVDTTNYVAAAAIVDWSKVVAVRLEVLVASIEDNVLPEVQTYRFNGVDNIVPNPSDRRLRQVFTSTLAVRNRTN
jgi:type IV pilus assembly protein PilW